MYLMIHDAKKFHSEPIILKETIDKIRSRAFLREEEFDSVFPDFYKAQSSVHWSPIKVAQRISDWINPLTKSSFVDIGCGVGKLCLLLRILTDYKIYGIEQRPQMVDIANRIIESNQFDNISISEKNMLQLNWNLYDIYFLYNPFQEHIANFRKGIIDHDLNFDAKFYTQYTCAVHRELMFADTGKILITYHGYGGSIPSSWKMMESAIIKNGLLAMWQKE